MKNGFERINLWERPEWTELFDFSGELGEKAADWADQQTSGIVDMECWEVITDLLDDFYRGSSYDESPKDWSPKLPTGVGEVGVSRLCEGLRAGQLPETWGFIRDSLYFAYEKALLPSDSDISHAIFEARSAVLSEFELGEIWDPLIEAGIPGLSSDEQRTRNNIIDLLTGKVTFEWDIYRPHMHTVQFSFIDTYPVGLLKTLDPSVDMKRLNREFERLRDTIMREFFRTLKSEAKEFIPENRVEWKAQWRKALKDNEVVKPVQQEMLEYLRDWRSPR